jgi:hypothetical protein
MLPCPVVLPVYWFSSATMPANIGAETDVPPMIEKLVPTAVGIPSAQLLPVR